MRGVRACGVAVGAQAVGAQGVDGDQQDGPRGPWRGAAGDSWRTARPGTRPAGP